MGTPVNVPKLTITEGHPLTSLRPGTDEGAVYKIRDELEGPASVSNDGFIKEKGRRRRALKPGFYDAPHGASRS